MRTNDIPLLGGLLKTTGLSALAAALAIMALPAEASAQDRGGSDWRGNQGSAQVQRGGGGNWQRSGQPGPHSAKKQRWQLATVRTEPEPGPATVAQQPRMARQQGCRGPAGQSRGVAAAQIPDSQVRQMPMESRQWQQRRAIENQTAVQQRQNESAARNEWRNARQADAIRNQNRDQRAARIEGNRNWQDSRRDRVRNDERNRSYSDRFRNGSYSDARRDNDWRDNNRGDRNWRDNDRRSDRNWRENNNRRSDRNWRDNDRLGDRNWRDSNSRWGSHDWRDNNRYAYGGNHRKWDRNWRNNSRYDWRRYRSYNRDYYRLGSYYSPYHGYSYSRLSVGFFLDSLFYSSRYWIDDPGYYRLPEAYGPYRWVRYYDDALLVDIYSGEVIDVIYDFFW